MEVKFGHIDILSNPKLKEWLKFYSNWPTFPQCYVNSKFIGGCEMVIELIESEEFLTIIPQECIKTNALERIKIAMAKSIVVVFMKGTPKKPSDGYQLEVIQMLDKERIRYAYFDVLKDPVQLQWFNLFDFLQDVREILKEYSKCISYP